MIRKTLMILLVLCCICIFNSCKEEQETSSTTEAEKTINDPRLFQPGKLTVATGEPAYPPWVMDDNPSSGEGFESELVYALATELGFAKKDVVWVRQTFDQGVAPGKKPYDFNLQQYSITEERREFVDFSAVYYKPEKAVVALPDTALAEAQSYKALRSVRWGATIGTTDLDYIENVIGVSEIAVYNTQVDTFQALVGGQIDATVISLPTALYVTFVQVPESTIAAILPHDEKDLGFGFIFEKDNPIVEWIDEGLKALIADGVVADLTSKYLITDSTIPVISE